MFKIITSTIPGFIDPSVAIAGSRAGALGILDLTSCLDATQAVCALQKLSLHAGKEYGVKLQASMGLLLEEILPAFLSGFSTVILVPVEWDQLAEVVAYFREIDLIVMLECVSLEEAHQGIHCKVDGLIAKGNEAGGRVGEETTFIFLQKLCAASSLPIWAHGGVGLHTAAACLTAGADGVILDSQLIFTREFTLDKGLRKILSLEDGRKTRCMGEDIGEIYRVLPIPGGTAFTLLQETENRLYTQQATGGSQLRIWRQSVVNAVNSTGQRRGPEVFFVGQDIAFATELADVFVTVGGIVQGIRDSVENQYRLAENGNPYNADSPMARSHGTDYAIVQGPMARVSDIPEFARSVAVNGALPLLAAAWSRGEDLDALLSKTGGILADYPWGVGLLGFLPGEIYAEQLDIVLKYRPPFALLAGGQPYQVKTLEEHGICTYVHIPTVNFLALFLDAGLCRFVFEGREAGGHVGPFCSFVLWETMIQYLLNHAQKQGSLNGIHILFAGGICDATSAAMIAVMAAPLIEYGATVGLQIGSAYLFTSEAVESGAIVEQYQKEVLQCSGTTLLETGPGHAVRCVKTPFVKRFRDEKRRLATERYSFEESKEILEKMERGRLRIAAKGMSRSSGGDFASNYELSPVNDAFQNQEGNYLVGQMAGLQSNLTTIAGLHQDLAINGYNALVDQVALKSNRAFASLKQNPSDIAIIGMAGFFPSATTVSQYWSNIVNKVSSIREIPRERWDYSLLFDENIDAPDRIYSKWGTFMDDIPFDPLQYGMPPKMVPSVEPLHLMTLESVRQALSDAGYEKRPFDRERTAVVMGISGAGELAQLYGFRTLLPLFFGKNSTDIIDHFDRILPTWTEDSFPGILMNVAAGRISNRFDFGGMNTLVDAACASSLAALYSAVKELETGGCDMAVVGGADCMQNPLTYMCFSKTHALSPRGLSNCLDAKADGIVIGEAIVTVILKRVEDAERDGDRVYAVIKGMGASSDGKDRSLTAPGIKGQIRALRRAYAKAGISPADVGLFEAHATGTVEGDRVEVESLSRVLIDAGAVPHSCAIGSVKSMIGHSKSAAGLASLVKAVNALHHKVLPPTAGVDTPNPGLQKKNSPLYANSETRPWLNSKGTRRAGISAFGFGGTNYHAVIEEYKGNYYEAEKPASYQQWPTEIFCWKAKNTTALLQILKQSVSVFKEKSDWSLSDLSYATCRAITGDTVEETETQRLAIVARSYDDLFEKLDSAVVALEGNVEKLIDPRGIFFSKHPLAPEGKTAFLFPGQGSQYVNMFGELVIQFPWMHELFERSNQILADTLSMPLSSFIFPAPVFTDNDAKLQGKALARTTVAQPAMGTVDLAMYHLCSSFGIEPDMVAGHSYGEYVALCVAGVLGEEELVAISEARARFILFAAGGAPGTMAAVDAALDSVEKVIASLDSVWIANINAPDQVVITGTEGAVTEAITRLADKKITARNIPVSCAFHSPLIASTCKDLESYLNKMELKMATLPVYSNTTACLHSENSSEIRAALVEHVVSKVRFVEQIENMYQAGARIFVECGPNRVLSGLVSKILRGKPHVSLVTNQRGRSALTQLHFFLAELIANGVDVNFEPLFAGRTMDQNTAAQKELTSTTWLLNGSRVRPVGEEAVSAEVEPFSVVQQKPPVDSRSGQPLQDLKSVNYTVHNTSGEGDEVLIGFQNLMRRFLDTQQEVMSGYLGQRRTNEEDTPQDGSGTEVKTGEGSADITGGGSRLEIQSIVDKVEKETDLQERLLKVVCDRTGYPIEMIGLDSDLEADLGIDSIKRVEILGEFFKSFGPAEQQTGKMSSLEGARTLRQILEKAADILAQKIHVDIISPDTGEKPVLTSNGDQLIELVGHLPRCLVVPKQSALSGETRPLPKEKTIIITDDGMGIAETLAAKLLDCQLSVIILRQGEKARKERWVEYSLSDMDLPLLTSTIRQKHGSIGGFIHLLPLQFVSPLMAETAAEWHQHCVQIVKPFFLLLQAFGKDIREDGNGFAMTVTSFDGMHGLGKGSPASLSSGHGALNGLMKTIALEWPEVRVKVVDLALPGKAVTIAQNLFAELTAAEEQVEVGWVADERFCLSMQLQPINESGQEVLAPDSSWVLLVTGGARGITARVAFELAKRFKPTLILVGRSPQPSMEEGALTENLGSAHEIKQAIIKQAKSEGTVITIPEVDQAYRKIMAAREIRTSLAGMRQAGSQVVYHQLDVCSDKQFTLFISQIHDQYGRLDGVIHGAGIIEDKLFIDKKWESFEKVFFTKAESTFTLAKALTPLKPRFLALFSSVAGCFGNIGQCDYAAANEVMNKTALWLHHHWPGRVVSLNWGPWAGSGMATSKVQEQFRQRQVHLVDQDMGAEAFVREICYGCQDEVEIILGDGPWLVVASPPTLGIDFSLIQGGRILKHSANSASVELNLNINNHHYLTDHLLDGMPVLPTAMATEMMAEASLVLYPEKQISSVRDIRVLKGIVVNENQQNLVISIQEQNDDSEVSTLHVEIREQQGTRLSYSGDVELRDVHVPGVSPSVPPLAGLHLLEMSCEEIYKEWLFHGPLFQCISNIEGFCQDGMRATMQTSNPQKCLTEDVSDSWLVDPVVLDGGLQLALIWARQHHDITVLPSFIRAVHVYKPFSLREYLFCQLEVVEVVHPQSIIFNIYFMDENRQLFGMIEGVEATGSQALNRLAGRIAEGRAI